MGENTDRLWQWKPEGSYEFFDRSFRDWFEFGIYPATGNIDINDGVDDILVNVPKELAVKIMAARDTYTSAVLKAVKEHYDGTQQIP